MYSYFNIVPPFRILSYQKDKKYAQVSHFWKTLAQLPYLPFSERNEKKGAKYSYLSPYPSNDTNLDLPLDYSRVYIK